MSCKGSENTLSSVQLPDNIYPVAPGPPDRHELRTVSTLDACRVIASLLRSIAAPCMATAWDRYSLTLGSASPACGVGLSRLKSG